MCESCSTTRDQNSAGLYHYSVQQHCRVGLNAIFSQKLQSFLHGGTYQNLLLGFLKIQTG